VRLRAGGILVTTDYVVDETLTTIRPRLGLPVAEAWWQQVDGSPRLRLESIDVGRDVKAVHGDATALPNWRGVTQTQ